MIRLTQEEEAISFKEVRYRDNLEFISMLQAAECSAKAQLKKVVKWLDEHNGFNEYGAKRRGAGLVLTIKDWRTLREIE